MEKIEVHIMGQSYILASSSDGEALLRQAVEKVDIAMCQIRDAGKIKARDRIAVLAALNIAAQSLSSDSNSAVATNPAADAPDYKQLIAKLDDALALDDKLL